MTERARKPKVSGPSGRSLTYAEHKAKGRPMISLTPPALTLAMLDRLVRDVGRPESRTSIVARLVATEYLRMHGTKEPWSDLPTEERPKAG